MLFIYDYLQSLHGAMRLFRLGSGKKYASPRYGTNWTSLSILHSCQAV